MKTVIIKEPFDGYPSGKFRSFTKGETEVPDEFAAIIVEKGLAREKPTDEPAAAEPAKPDHAPKRIKP